MTYFSGKQAIVTGAGSGIGAALSRALVAAGADVLCTDIDAD
ncbi:MAG: SDR family NAD(P)-dependent oxidoreductase, partial [Mycobacterium sp.]